MNPLNILLVLGLVTAASSIPFSSVITEEWQAFKAFYGKKYDNRVEESFRMKIFAENKYMIAQHNKLHSLGLKSYSLKMNQFGDMLHQEFLSVINGQKKMNVRELKELRKTKAISYIETACDVILPDHVDWRDRGAVTGVKDQGACGSAYAFSATGSLEGQHFRKTGKLISLSEQNLVDCSSKSGNLGCNGGLMDNAFEYIKENNGIDTENSYPYETTEGECRFNNETVGATDKGYADIPEGNEEALRKAVATIGPISVAIDASQRHFIFYFDGVYHDTNCSSTVLDHAALVVGYGTEDGTPYWLVKNSWGTYWGLDGYIKMSRNRGNNCGIASLASYPLI